MTNPRLIKYDAARKALERAHRVDEAKDWRDKALAVAAYARQVKDGDMIRWATEIKVRAERRMGELLREMDKHPGGGPGRGKKNQSPPPTSFSGATLKSLGLTKQQSSDAQKLAAIPEPEFEQRISEAGRDSRGITTEAILKRRMKPPTFDPLEGERIWDAPRLWMADVEKLPAIDDLKKIRPKFGREALSKHFKTAREYMQGLEILAGEGYL